MSDVFVKSIGAAGHFDGKPQREDAWRSAYAWSVSVHPADDLMCFGIEPFR